jgi:integrase
MSRTRAHEKHMLPTPSGIRAQIRIDGVLHRQHFRTGTPIITIRQWLLKTEMAYRGKRARKTGRFEDDARAYLATVTAMPSYSDRQRHIEEWIAVFGATPRATISSDDITAQLQKWATEPRVVTRLDQQPQTIVLSASSVNQRRTALMHLYTTLDGKAAPNPVRDTPKFREPDARPRHLSYATIRKLFAAMPASQSKARLMVLAYTGIPHKQIATIAATDVDLKAGTVTVAGRRKGSGTHAVTLPLTKEGIAAFKMMAREDAWGPFSRGSLRKAFVAAATKIGLEGARPYDLRHSFGTEVLLSTGSMQATQLLMMHSKDTLTRRYTLAAESPVMRAAVKKFGKRR